VVGKKRLDEPYQEGKKGEKTSSPMPQQAPKKKKRKKLDSKGLLFPHSAWKRERKEKIVFDHDR